MIQPTMLARDYDGRVQVVNNQRISVTQRQSVLDAIALRDAGKNAAEIKEKLEEEKMESSILYYSGNSEISEKKVEESLRLQLRSERF